MYYILNADKTVSEVANVLEWADVMKWNRRWELNLRVSETLIPYKGWVSTVFLGIDHNWDEGPPVLFETMVFGGPFDQEQWRYRTYDEALSGHEKVVEIVKAVPLWLVLVSWVKRLPKLARRAYWDLERYLKSRLLYVYLRWANKKRYLESKLLHAYLRLLNKK